MSIESHCPTNCNITTNIYVTTYHSLCVVNVLLVAQNGLGRNGLAGSIESHFFRENSIVQTLALKSVIFGFSEELASSTVLNFRPQIKM